jgi:hypothetical protein
MGKYEPLARFLAAQSKPRVRANFREIERVLGFSLPQSAKEYEAWWSNNGSGHSHAQAWLGTGWRTEDLNLGKSEVTFARVDAAPRGRTAHPRPDPWGCMAGTVTIFSGTDLTRPTDEEWNAEKGLILDE